MILHESAKAHHWMIHIRTAERLSKLTGISREEITERAKEIYAIEGVRYIGTQSDAIYSSADLPKMFSSRPRVHIAGLIMIFATCAVSRIGPSEGDDAGDVNLRAERLIRAQDDVSRGSLKAQIADGFRTQDRCEGCRESVVAREAAAARARVYEAVGVERIAWFLVVREGVTQHQGSIFRDLVLELARSFRFRARNGRESC